MIGTIDLQQRYRNITNKQTGSVYVIKEQYFWYQSFILDELILKFITTGAENFSDKRKLTFLEFGYIFENESS